MKSQQQTVLALLQQAGSAGVNSYDLTYKWSIKQAPTRVKELKEKGYHIISQVQFNRSVQYILLDRLQVGTVLTFKSNPSGAPTVAEKRDHIIIIKVNGEDMAKYVTKSEYEKFNKPEQQSLI